jgi:hypothetical protein
MNANGDSFLSGQLLEQGDSVAVECSICEMRSDFFEEAQILRKYQVKFFRCKTCGFVQTEAPYWLDDAYSTAISRLDTGILYRNLQNLRVTSAVIDLLFPQSKKSLDFGAGHGIFVRLMRDRGFNFFWYDLHASNDYARGFESKMDATYDFLTSFEVLEHLADPLKELSAMMERSPNILVSTELLPHPTPRISEWWYYSPLGGQHVSFFTAEALAIVARRFKRHLLSHGPFHLFSIAPQSKFLFRLAASQRGSRVLNAIRRRPSLMSSDHELMSK